jgi:hypothetical protein
MKKAGKIFLGLLALAFAAAGYGFYLYHKKPPDTRKEPPAYEIASTTLVAAFNKNETAASLQFLDKVIAVKGVVTIIKIDSADQATVFLDGGDPMDAVICSFYKEELSSVKNLHQGQEVTIKGNCTGKLMDVVLNKCSITK